MPRRRLGQTTVDFEFPSDEDFYGPENVDYTDAELRGAPQYLFSPSSNLLGDAIARLREAGSRFVDAYAQFSALESDVIGTAKEAEWRAVKDHADNVFGTMRSIEEGVGSAWQGAKDVLGLGAVRRIGRLGILPAIPLTYVAITAAIAVVIASANAMMEFVANWRRGVVSAPGEAGPIERTMTQGASAAKWIALGVAVFMLAPPLLKALESRR